MTTGQGHPERNSTICVLYMRENTALKEIKVLTGSPGRPEGPG